MTGTIGSQPAQGAATARLDAPGTFYVLTPRGLRCEGTYDSLSTAPTITAPVRCTDGRTGTLIITRSMDLLSGTVIGELSDGTPAQFVFGNLSYGQAFGVGGAQTSPLR